MQGSSLNQKLNPHTQ